MARRSGLHPFSERFAFVVGGGVLLLCLGVFVWQRTRTPPPAAVARAVQVGFAPVDAARLLTSGARVPRQAPLVVRASNDLPRPAYAVAFALDGRGQLHWFIPARPEAGAATIPPGAAQRELPAADRRLPIGPVRLVTVHALEPIDPRAVEAQVAAWWRQRGDLSRAEPLGLGSAEASIWIEIVGP